MAGWSCVGVRVGRAWGRALGRAWGRAWGHALGHDIVVPLPPTPYPRTLTSPRINFGSRLSRRLASVRDSSMFC